MITSASVAPAWIARLAAEGAIDAFAAALARRLVAAAAPASEAAAAALALAAVLAHDATRSGDTCVDLARVAGQPLFDGRIEAPGLAAWRAALAVSPMVACAGEVRPLVLDASDRLYLHRYFTYEQRLAARLRALAEMEDDSTASSKDDPPDWLERFGASLDASQRAAVARAARSRLAVVAGGPGAGKTRTVAVLLATLYARYGAGYRIALAAPTGKAAARLQESLAAARAGVVLPDAVAAAWPQEVRTVHRLLGPVLHASAFRHDAAHPLALDCLVVDEASMIDLALAAKLAAALPPGARLVLLGDPDQLASVEAGAVLASLCAAPPRAKGDALAASVVRLTGSHRFGDASAIGRLARAVRDGDVAALPAALAGADADADVSARLLPAGASALEDTIGAGFDDYVAAVAAKAPPEQVLAALDRFRILAAERHGPLGTLALNARVARRLDRAAGARAATPDRWFAGRAVIVTANDYGLGLFNGDVGVALPEASGALRVFFRAAEGGVRAIAPARLPDCETAFALTVHRAQGSEFDRVLVVLPDPASPLATRELVYTAITRARHALVLAGDEQRLVGAIERRQVRRSGLADALWGRL